MVGQDGKLFIGPVIIVSIVVPFGLILMNSSWGGFSLLVGMFMIYRVIRLARLTSLESNLDSEDALYAKTDTGGTIYVQLIDEEGNLLPIEVARAKLNAARQLAGPRDAVLGVHRKVG
ncbi:MAG: hypothetical protein H7Z42_09250 [Roseiflexaceae bacterium]|nr:hypothetical protein [Roseiflexaceae bacterium]